MAPALVPVNPIITRANAGIFKSHYAVHLASTILLSALISTFEPHGFKFAAKSLEWLAAMQEEIDALHVNQTWNMVPCPPYTNIVGSKWVFCTKFHADGTIEHHKAGLVA